MLQTDTTRARNIMVDGQLRPNKVTDARILHAMRRLPRERFLPARLAALAYADEDVPLGEGRVLMEPMVLARLIQALAPRAGERALVAACGTGYGAAVLAATGARVTALEENAGLAAQAKSALAEVAPGVTLVTGPIAAGWAEGGLWDMVLIEGAVAAIPPAYAGLVKPGAGRLATVISSGARTGYAALAELTPAGLVPRPLFDCATVLLPGFGAAPGFRF